MLKDITLSEDVTPPSWSSDPLRADYACPAYREMAGRWELVRDVRAGTPRIRAKRDQYLPKFEAETDADWISRVGMTFAEDHYARTVVDHTGLVFSQPIKVGDDVPPQINALLEDIDGEGNHFDVFAQEALDAALHLGHAIIFTDYPVTDGVRTLQDERLARVRPYATLYHADDVLAWRTAVVGGVRVLVHIMLREQSEGMDGEFGVRAVERFREIRQAVAYDDITGRARALGAITWRTFERPEKDAPPVEVDSGTIVGPSRIPARVVYGGERIGFMHTRPHLIGLAMKSIEEVQVQSDYAAVMHKCNVPTPIFIGRQAPPPGTESTIKMGQGIDIPTGGDAKMLEPSGNALSATRQRLEDIRHSIQRQGASAGDATGKTLTVTEAEGIAKQRNAKLTRAARSLQDALEGMLMDMAAFLKLAEGGSVMVNQEFSGQSIDPALLKVYVDAYREGALPLEALMFALQNGRLPDDFMEEDEALRLVANHAAEADAEPVDAPVPETDPSKPPELPMAA